MSMGKALLVAGYFGALGYGVAKSGADKKIALAIKNGYTALVQYTSEVSSETPRTLMLSVDKDPDDISGN